MTMILRWLAPASLLAGCAVDDYSAPTPYAWQSGAHVRAQVFRSELGTGEALAGWFDLDSGTSCAYLTARATFVGCGEARAPEMVEAAHELDGIDYTAVESTDGFTAVTALPAGAADGMDAIPAAVVSRWRVYGRVRQSTGLYDRALGIDCHGYLDAAGHARCLPAEPIVQAYLGDAQCTVETGTVPVTLGARLGVDLVATKSGPSNLPLHYEHVYRCDQPLPSPVYYRDPARGCTQITNPMWCSTVEADVTSYAPLRAEIQLPELR